MKKSVSCFISQNQIKALTGESDFPNILEKEIFEQQMQEIFFLQGRIPNYERLMGNFPMYLEKHIEVIKRLFHNDLNISGVWRYYIAYMAAAAHKCEYLMKLLEYLCKQQHQDWFENSSDVPEKLQSLYTVNVKLAHRPWEFTEVHVRTLLSHWTPNELVLALTILCQFHSLSGFIFGLGVTPEQDLSLSTFTEPQSPLIKQPKQKTDIVSLLKDYSENAEYDDYMSDSSEDIQYEEETEENYFSKAAGGYLSYVNYPMDSISRSFNASDFKFSDQAYYILEKMVPEVSESIWDRIRFAFVMTYEHVGDDGGVETGPLRRAIWNYVQRVYGLQYDDYRYKDINRFLKINMKKYIKKTACFPETVLRKDFESIELDLHNYEMIHVNLLICEARFEAQLVYMLHAVQRVLGL